MKRMLKQSVLCLALAGLSLVPVAALPLPVLTGDLTATGVIDSSFNLLDLDIRGTVGLQASGGAVLLTDTSRPLPSAIFNWQASIRDRLTALGNSGFFPQHRPTGRINDSLRQRGNGL